MHTHGVMHKSTAGLSLELKAVVVTIYYTETWNSFDNSGLAWANDSHSNSV